MNPATDDRDKIEVGFKSAHGKGGFLRNLVTNIKGPAASVVLVVWLAAVVVISIYGKTPFASPGLGLLTTFIVMYLIILGNRPN